jgi:xeroderma pigmentosum group C-complementing protein
MTLTLSTQTVLETAETVLSKDDFRKQAAVLQGSRDLGAQLFCALIRSAGVDTRLVCSLQPLPFSGVARGMPIPKPEREYIVLSEDEVGEPSGDVGDLTLASLGVQNALPRRMRRLTQPQFSPSSPTSPKSRHETG